MKVISGKIDKAVKVVLYAPEGFGKSTFASHFPKPIFIDTEGGTNQIECDRTEKPETFTAVMNDIADAIDSDYKTIVLDTIDWAERLSIEDICHRNQVSSIESFGYGKGYTFNQDNIGKMLNRLQDAVEKGKHVVILAHCMTRKQERPNDPAFDRYELKLTKQTAPLVKEWADVLLFANYKYIIYEDKGSTKKKVSGGKRVMYASHNPCWDAKNRFGLPDEMEFDYKCIAGIIPESIPAKSKPVPQKKEPPKEPEKKADKVEPKKVEPKKQENNSYKITKELGQLMEHDKVSMEQIMNAVYKKGYFPKGTQFEDLPEDFVQGCIIAGWNKGLLKLIRDMEEAPF